VYTGLTGTVGYQLYNADGTASGSRVTAGISEQGSGTGFYHVLLSLADGWVGSIQWDTGGASPIYGIEDIRAVMTDAASREANGLLFESTVVSYQGDPADALFITGGPNQNNAFAFATVVVYDASNDNAPNVQQIGLSEYSVEDGETYLSLVDGFDFTPVAGDLVRIYLSPTAVNLWPTYNAAKTAASSTDISDLQTHGDEVWETATGFATSAAMTNAFTEIKGSGWSASTDTLEKLENASSSISGYLSSALTGLPSVLANQTSLLNRMGAWTGSGVNTILGAFKALLSKTASAPSDIGGTFTPTTDSVEAIRDTEPLGTAMRGTDSAATAINLAAAVTKIDTINGIVDAIVEDTGTTLPAAIEGIEGGGGTGTGARTVAITVNDGTSALESARVRFTKGAESYVGSTNASGLISFSLDDGTWSVAISLAGYTFTPTTRVVDGDETQTYSMTLVTVTPSDPGFITGYWQCYDEEGIAEAGQTVQMRMKVCSGYGMMYDSKIRSEDSDANGLATFTNLDPGMTYQVRRGESGKWIDVTIPSTATSPYALQSIVGSDE